jgi:hypothetical protein
MIFWACFFNIFYVDKICSSEHSFTAIKVVSEELRHPPINTVAGTYWGAAVDERVQGFWSENFLELVDLAVAPVPPDVALACGEVDL